MLMSYGPCPAFLSCKRWEPRPASAPASKSAMPGQRLMLGLMRWSALCSCGGPSRCTGCRTRPACPPSTPSRPSSCNSTTPTIPPPACTSRYAAWALCMCTVHSSGKAGVQSSFSAHHEQFQSSGVIMVLTTPSGRKVAHTKPTPLAHQGQGPAASPWCTADQDQLVCGAGSSKPLWEAAHRAEPGEGRREAAARVHPAV